MDRGFQEGERGTRATKGKTGSLEVQPTESAVTDSSPGGFFLGESDSFSSKNETEGPYTKGQI